MATPQAQPPDFHSNAVALYHFNIHYVAGDEQAAHRYCAQAVLPALHYARHFPHGTLTFEFCGSGLEFINRYYPEAIQALRDLVAAGRVELLSSTYTPSIWVAFPRRDLVRSIELNRRLLRSLDLSVEPVFFAQESFFGPGLRQISDLFEYAICKEEQIPGGIPEGMRAAIYSMGGLKVLVGSGHLLNELAENVHLAVNPDLAHVREVYRQAFETARANLHGAPGSLRQYGDSRWRWLHLGSAHHLVASRSPNDLLRFRFDPVWHRLVDAHFCKLHESGIRFAGIGDYIRATSSLPTQTLPDLVECSWNPTRSSGVFQWMGLNANPWENDTANLGYAWRSRHLLRCCEDHLEAAGNLDPKIAAEVIGIWKLQLLAESSDPLGWNPLPSESRVGAAAATQAATQAASLLFKLGVAIHDPIEEELTGFYLACPPPIGTSVVGEGHARWSRRTDGLALCLVEITSADGFYGVDFEYGAGLLTYCPSAAEHTLAELPNPPADGSALYLPLANGLVGIGGGRYLIRLNQSGQPALRLSSKLSFYGQGRCAEVRSHWKFLFFQGASDTAIDLANRWNHI